jgi:hypothetical protein
MAGGIVAYVLSFDAFHGQVRSRAPVHSTGCASATQDHFDPFFF